MPTMWETFPIEIGGGLVKDTPPIQQGLKQPGTARRLVNFEPSIRGGYRRINGYTKYDSTAVPAVDSANIILGVGLLDNEVIVVREGSIYTGTGSGWTAIDTGRTQTTKHRFTTINLDGTKKIIGVDGVNYPYSWNGSTFTNINSESDVEGASHVAVFKNHVFYATEDLVSFSIPFDEEDFTIADGAGNFRMPNDVTGMIVFRDQLFVFTEEEIKVLSGSSASDFVLTSVAEDIGCLYPDTIQEVSGDVAFLSSDGLRLLGATDRIGDFNNGLTNKAIQVDFNDFKENYTSFASCLVRGKSQYRIFGYTDGRPASSTVGYIGVQFQPQDHESFQWSQTQGLKVYSVDSAVHRGEETIIFSNDTDYVYTMEEGASFDGELITSSFWTPYISLSDPKARKAVYKATLYFSPEGSLTGSMTLNFDQNSSSKIQPSSIMFDAVGSGSLWGEKVWGDFSWSDAPDATLVKQVIGTGFNVSLEFEFTESQEPFIFDTIMLEYSQEDRK